MPLSYRLQQRLGPLPCPNYRYPEYAVHDLSHWVDFGLPLREVPDTLNLAVADKLEGRAFGAGVVPTIPLTPEQVSALTDMEVRASAVAELTLDALGMQASLTGHKVSMRQVAKELGHYQDSFEGWVDTTKRDRCIRRMSARVTRWLKAGWVD